MKQNKKVLLINQSHTSNLGDQVIGRIIEEQFSEYMLFTIPYIPTQIKEDINIAKVESSGKISTLIDRLKLTTIINDIKYFYKINKIIGKDSYDAAIIGGGELLSGNLEFNSAFVSWTKVLFKKGIPIIVAGVSGNEVSKRLGKRYEWALQKCSYVTVRDRKTQDLLLNKYGVEAQYVPDFAFLYNINKEKIVKEETVTAQIYCYEYVDCKDESGRKISKRDYFEKWYNLLLQCVENNEIIQLTYSDKDDKVTTEEFKEYIRNSYNYEFEIQKVNEIEDMINVLLKTKKLVTGRMHPMIFGMLCDDIIVPFFSKEKIRVFNEEWLQHNSKIIEPKIQIKKLISDIKLLIEG